MHRWSPDGQELYYWTRDALMVVSVESEPSFNAGTPEVLLQRAPFWSFSMGSQGISWDVHPDGKRFLMIKLAEATDEESTEEESAEEEPQRIIVVLNWFEELKERVPVQ
jgi:hypothetical protein